MLLQAALGHREPAALRRLGGALSTYHRIALASHESAMRARVEADRARLGGGAARRRRGPPAGRPPPPGRQPPAEPVVVLLGRTRAAVLEAAAVSAGTTSELARRVGVAPPVVSRQTAVLREAGLLDSTRHGGTVVHRATALGIALLNGELPG
ncbi:ArsR/SmtB family transcription factor [Streptomyces roseifaciens]